MRKILFTILAASLWVGFAFAAEVSIPNPLQYNTFYDLMRAIATFIFNLAIPLTVIVIIIAGFNFMFSEGDPTKVSRAKQLLLWAVIGFLVIAISGGLMEIIKTQLIQPLG